MPSFEFVRNFVCENVEQAKIRGNHIHGRCPICGDSKRSGRKKRFHLEFHTNDYIEWHCFNCEASGNFYKLYAFIKHITPTAAYRECESVDGLMAGSRDRLEYHRPEEQPKHYLENFNWILKECLSEYNYEPGLINDSLVEALKSFRQSRQIPSKVPLFIAHKGRYKGRIIIPVFDTAGNIVYFQGRVAVDGQEPKYLNPTAEKSIIIPNIQNLTSPAIVTEGLIDSFTLGEHGTCALGKEIPESFLDKVFTKVSQVIIAFDNDAEGRKALIKFMKENKHANRVKYFIMPAKYSKIKDFNELQTSEKDINMIDFVLTNSYPFVRTVALLKIGAMEKYER